MTFTSLVLLLLSQTTSMADTARDTFWYCGSTYTPASSETISEFGNGPIVIKKLQSETSPLMLTLFSGDTLAEINVPIEFSTTNSRFEFNSPVIMDCQGVGCEGIDSVKGFLKRIRSTNRLELHIKYKFFSEDEETGKLRTWSQNAVYNGAPSNSNFCR